MRYSLLILLLLAPLFSVQGECIFFEIGPEIYHMRRWREGGTHQSGRMDGIYIAGERFKKEGWYVGADALFATGNLNGKSGSGRTLRSVIDDTIYEGRLGYTFQSALAECSFFTPYGGYGYFRETNTFYPPSPIPFKFIDTFNYFTCGFLSGVNFTPLLSMGVNFKVRFMLNGKSKVENDPLFDSVTLLMNNETHYQIEIPMTYGSCQCWGYTEAAFIPFYEFRHFGGRMGFPFDYIDTKFSLWGAKLTLAYRF